MDLKNAVAVCLISLFSATLVVLIARALDLQAASKLEPQLAQIVEELRAIRTSGGISAAPAAATPSDAIDDGLVVYYFHGNVRCATCQAIESQTLETVRSDFAAQLDAGEVAWKVLNYEEPTAAELTKKFEVQMPVVVLAKMKDGQIADWKRLDQVWALVGDKPAFAAFIRDEMQKILGEDSPQATAASPGDASEAVTKASDSADVPLPTGPSDIPLPQ